MVPCEVSAQIGTQCLVRVFVGSVFMLCVGNAAQQWQRWADEACEGRRRNLDLI